MRLVNRKFQFEKEKYLLIIDTDGLKLKVKCYNGSSEKGSTVKLARFSPLHNRIIDIIDEEYGSHLRNNFIHPEKIDPYVRRYFGIEYPASKTLVALKDTLVAEGALNLDAADNTERLVDYLEALEIECMSFVYGDEVSFITTADRAEEFLNRNRELVKKKQEEIKELEDLSWNLLNFRDNQVKKSSRIN